MRALARMNSHKVSKKTWHEQAQYPKNKHHLITISYGLSGLIITFISYFCGMNIGLYLIFGLVGLLARLPMRVLYVLSDCLFPLVFYVARYRRKLVYRQLKDSFPNKSQEWIRQTERKFYHFFCDYIMETLKLTHMSREEIMQRVTFEGLDELQAGMRKHNKQFAFAYLGHYGNWEWVASFCLHLESGFCGGQIYHPLKNSIMDRFFVRLREQFGGICIPMRETARHIVSMSKREEREIIGFIADQCPKWEAQHHWMQFLNHKTSFYVGSELMAKRVQACSAYVEVTRPKRGYYHCRVTPISWEPKEHPNYEITDLYASALEKQILEQPELWLWTHNRWKRTYEEWLRLSETWHKTRKNSTKDDL